MKKIIFGSIAVCALIAAITFNLSFNSKNGALPSISLDDMEVQAKPKDQPVGDEHEPMSQFQSINRLCIWDPSLKDYYDHYDEYLYNPPPRYTWRNDCEKGSFFCIPDNSCGNNYYQEH